MPGWFSFLPLPFFFFFYYHGGFTSVHRRFGDERDGIIPIPALPLSRSNSLTKLSDSILAPTARVNLLCHLQSTRGSAKSRSSLCQNPPTAPLFRSIKVYFLPFFLSLQYVCLYVFLFSFFSFFLSVSIVYLAIFTLVETLPSVVRDVYSRHKTYATKNTQVVMLYTHNFDLDIVCFIIFSRSLLMFDKSPTVYFFYMLSAQRHKIL